VLTWQRPWGRVLRLGCARRPTWTGWTRIRCAWWARLCSPNTLVSCCGLLRTLNPSPNVATPDPSWWY